MLICPKCNNQQESGKFCGVCGGTLQPVQNSEVSGNESIKQAPVNSTVNQAAATVTNQQQQGQQTTTALKSGLAQYWAYFLSLIKNPTQAFNSNENHFVNGLVTLVLFAITFSLSLYLLANSFMKAALGGFMSTGLPFFAVNSRLVFVAIIALVISFGSAFIMIKTVKNQESFKAIIAQYGSLFVPFTALNIIAMVGGIMASIQLTVFPLVLSTSLSLVFLPVLFVYEKASKINNQGQKVYFAFATILLISLIYYIFGESILTNMVEDLERNFNSFPF
ncbi:hypothetical protein CIL05_16825 [Virgibacillus profundi]|uniref:Zinc ribbon domain-containing protein n=1 Tax=Virgibacillus profundi TaxID=2024555 RepID=A0A2A2IB06_9BACI|nr:hypothetical protein [Virgibacillus profundi]PAV28300.1 hypothetical protein CIL05_16825 [Virgibacillus profundi]PXY54911.1 hypothetical protein CIT14_03160 [Virgibacillus profundi]